MTKEQLSERLKGKTILEINFTGGTESNLAIETIKFTDGELLTITDQITLSHPEAEDEQAAFYEVLKNIPPNGIISFKAKHLSQGMIDREMAAMHKKLKSNGYGQRNSYRQDYLTYRFDRPE